VLPDDSLRSNISQSAASANGLFRLSVIATIAAGREASSNLSTNATASPDIPDRDVTTSSESGVTSSGLSSSRPASIHHVAQPRETNRRQLGSAAKCDPPIPVKTIRSCRARTNGYKPNETGALPALACAPSDRKTVSLIAP
jgi:hypothetical protein